MGMWMFGGDFSLSPTVGDPAITFETVVSTFALVMEWGFGGEVTASTLMRTGVGRAAEGVGARTDVVDGIFNEGSAASVAFLTSSFATTEPAITAGPLWERSWNCHGGVVRWLAAPGQEVSMLDVATLILENSVGTSLSNYGFIWGEY